MSRLHPRDFLRQMIFYLFRIFPIQQNKIVFDNYFGRAYACNPKYITEALLAMDSSKSIDIVWTCLPKYKDTLAKGVRYVKYRSIRSYWELATAKVWVDNVRKRTYEKKRKKQFYIQTWHGAIGIKKSEGDAADKITPKFLKIAKYDSPQINLMISNSTFCTQFYKRAFWYHGPIAEFGYPRNDIFANPKQKISLQVRSFFNIDSSTSILLYAPTFRKTSALWDQLVLDLPRLLLNLEKKFNGKWVCLLRLHPWAVKHDANKPIFNSKIIDATHYPDIQELLLSAGVLVTDYSSCMFDYLIQKKPAFMYAPDIQNYVEERGLLMDPFTLPFTCATDNDELEKQVLEFDIENFIKKTELFFSENELKEDGFASQKTANLILNIIDNKPTSSNQTEVLE